MRETSTSKDTNPKKREKEARQSRLHTSTPPGHGGSGGFQATPCGASGWVAGVGPVASRLMGLWVPPGKLASVGVKVSLHIFCFLS